MVIEHVTDKSRLPNLISRYLNHNSDHMLLGVIQSAQPGSLHQIGAREGRLTKLISEKFNVPIRATLKHANTSFQLPDSHCGGG